MADYVLNNETFEFTYSAKQQEEIEQIRNKYLPKQESKIEQLRKLDKQAEMPGQIASITAGAVGLLILGVGMCCTMVWNAHINVFILGIVVGLIGIMMTGSAYPIYKKVTAQQRAKFADQIIALSNEIAFKN